MLQAQHYIELPGLEDMASFALKQLGINNTSEAAAAIARCLPQARGDAFFQLNALAATISHQAGEPDAALDYWDQSITSSPHQVKWLEAALSYAWNQSTEKARRYALRWQQLLQNIYIQSPSVSILTALTRAGWQGAGCIGIHEGSLKGWLWLRHKEKLQVSATCREPFCLNLKPVNKDSTHILYRVEEKISHIRGVWTVTLIPESSRTIQGSPLRISPASITWVPATIRQELVILVPVFDDKKATLSCFASLFASLKYNRIKPLILAVWDNGPDPALLTSLRKLAARRKIALLENRQNLGFLASVNNALSHTGNADVLLLNADTIVHGNWLDRMARAAAKEDTATVTAQSNEAELMSFPSAMERGKIRSIKDVAILDRAASGLDCDRAVMEIPVGVGFCMWITRKALNRIGGLDGHHLYKGYGEEVDFCLRARQAGLKNYGAFNVFVGHMGERSFGVTKKALASQNNAAIHSRFAKYAREYEEFLHEPAQRQIREELSLACLGKLNLPDILDVRPWNFRLLPPWLKDDVCEPEHTGCALFVQAGPNPRVILRAWGEFHLADIFFELPADFAKLRQALEAAGIHKAICSSKPGRELIIMLGIQRIENPEPPADLPPLSAACHTVIVAPPDSMQNWNRLVNLARSRPDDRFYLLFAKDIWPGMPVPPNILGLTVMKSFRPLGADGFTVAGDDSAGWRYWLDCHDGNDLPMYALERE